MPKPSEIAHTLARRAVPAVDALDTIRKVLHGLLANDIVTVRMELQVLADYFRREGKAPERHDLIELYISLGSGGKPVDSATETCR